MQLWHAIILGIVQGLGEFLPISSSAHLVIVPWLLRFEDPGLAFDVALHFGTLLALIAYFYKDWIAIFKSALSEGTLRGASLGAQYSTSPPFSAPYLLWKLALASVPGAAIGYILEKQADTLFRSPLLIAGTMAAMGLLLWVVDQTSSKIKSMAHIGFTESIFIGLSQALAIIPGVSRSGITITAGLALGLNRNAAARFSFLMATPITFGACLVKAKAFRHSGLNLELLAGIGVSAFFGFLSIKYMLSYLQHYSYKVFVGYRLAFSALVLVVYGLKHFF